MLKRLLKQDWDAIAGILAAITALILELLHIGDVNTLLAIAIVLLALLLLRDFRRENQAEKLRIIGRAYLFGSGGHEAGRALARRYAHRAD